MTVPKTWASAQKFIGAEPNSVWDQIYRNKMTDESFAENFNTLTDTLLKSKEVLTGYGIVEHFIYYSKPCQLKVVWKSPGKNL